MLRPKEVVCKWVDAFNNHDVEEITSLYHENATYLKMGSGQF